MSKRQALAFGQRLRHWRAIKGYSLRGFAREVKIDRSALSRIETGRQEAREGEVQTIVRVLGLTVAEFYGEAAA